MKRIIYLSIFSIVIFFILIYSNDIMENIRFSFSLCINNLFPSLIPFMLISNILINYDFINDISDILGNLMEKIFRVNKNCSFVFVMGVLSGTPSNAIYLKDLFNNNLISINDIRKSLSFIHFTNPIFILGTIGYTFLNNKKLGIVILISHYLSSFIIGIFNKKDNYVLNLKIKTYNKINNDNFISILKNSIKSTIDTLFLILGIITICLIITCILNNILNINNNYKFLYGLIEVTQGLKFLSISNLNIKFKTILSSFLISFGGICIHAQVFSILDNKKIRYIPYFISRLFHGILSAIFSIILLSF